jgi:hypothetical protein
MSDFLSQIQIDEVDGPTEADWADYAEYLDSIGYDDPDEDCDYFDEDGSGFTADPFNSPF